MRTIPAQRVLLALLSLAFASARGQNPTEYEQYLLELVNRTRMDPEAEVARAVATANAQPGYYKGSFRRFQGAAGLNEGPPKIEGVVYAMRAGSRQPLAFNARIMAAAQKYSLLMQQRNTLSHGLDGYAEDRMAREGYVGEFPFDDAVETPDGWFYGPGNENLGFAGQSNGWSYSGSGQDLRRAAVDLIHHNLFVDTSVASRGHRITLLVGAYEEVGFGVSYGSDGAESTVYVAQNFGFRYDRGPFITGVAYRDVVKDAFYTPGRGEALGGLGVSVYRAGTRTVLAETTTYPSGGYSAAVPQGSTVDVRFTGDGIDHTIKGVEVGNENVKVDAVDPGIDPVDPVMPFAITRIASAGRDVTIEWSPVPGARYQVLASPDLKNWSPVGNPVDGGFFKHGSARDTDFRFYRVERLAP